MVVTATKGDCPRLRLEFQTRPLSMPEGATAKHQPNEAKSHLSSPPESIFDDARCWTGYRVKSSDFPHAGPLVLGYSVLRISRYQSLSGRLRADSTVQIRRQRRSQWPPVRHENMTSGGVSDHQSRIPGCES